MGGRKQKGSSGSSEKRWRKGLEQEGRKERARRGNLQKSCSPEMEESAREELFSTGKIISQPVPSLPGLCPTLQHVTWLQDRTLEKEEAAGMLLWCLIYSCTLGLVFITMNYA